MTNMKAFLVLSHGTEVFARWSSIKF